MKIIDLNAFRTSRRIIERAPVPKDAPLGEQMERAFFDMYEAMRGPTLPGRFAEDCLPSDTEPKGAA